MSTQKALVISEIGKPLNEITRPIPTPKENQILVKIIAVGCTSNQISLSRCFFPRKCRLILFSVVNPHDQKVRDYGIFINNKVPAVVANDVAGVVVAIGPNVARFSAGDRVFGQSGASPYEPHSMDTGGLQQYTILDEDVTAKIPSRISYDEAASFPVNLIAPWVAFFHSSGFGIPAPLNDSSDSKDFDYQAVTVVIIGGGANTGKFGIQVASLAGFGKIIAVASSSNTEELKTLGATHVVDRHANNDAIKAEVQKIAHDEVVYVFDVINSNLTLAVSLLSSGKTGIVASLLPGKVEKDKCGKKEGEYTLRPILGSSHLHRELCVGFWRELSQWVESGKLTPLDFKVVEGGLSLQGANRVLDDYRDGKNPGKWHLHPSPDSEN